MSVYAVHPGVVRTNILAAATGVFAAFSRMMQPLMFMNVHIGAATQTYLAAATIIDPQYNGGYWTAVNPAKPHDLVFDEALTQKLWELSERTIGAPFFPEVAAPPKKTKKTKKSKTEAAPEEITQ